MSGKPLTPEERARTISFCDCGHRSKKPPISEHWEDCHLRVVAEALVEAERRGHAAGLREGAEITESHGRRVATATSVMRARAEEVERSE
jgi:hypothetical protein